MHRRNKCVNTTANKLAHRNTLTEASQVKSSSALGGTPDTRGPAGEMLSASPKDAGPPTGLIKLEPTTG